MRQGLLAVGLWLFTGAGFAQTAAPVAPITSLATTLQEVRNQASAIAALVTSDRLGDPVHLHEIASLLDTTALTLHELATHAEHGQITASQRAMIEAQLEQTRLRLERLSEQLRNTRLR